MVGDCETCRTGRLFLVGACVLALAILAAAYYTNLGSIEERRAVVERCNEKIDQCNDMLGKCASCIYDRVNLTEALNVPG